MKITKLRIKNYKSIIDSGDCYLESDLTILAGKNESGKTSILEALEDFNSKRPISENAIPIGNKNNLPEITLTLVLSPEDLNNYYSKVKIDRNESSETLIRIIKNYPNKYSIDDETGKLLEIKDVEDESKREEIKNKVKSVYLQLTQLHKQFLQIKNVKIFPLNLEDIQETSNQLNTYSRNFTSSYQRLIVNLNQRNTYINKIQELKSVISDFQNIKSGWNEKWDSFFELLPNFILFRTFEDIIPNEIPFDQLEKSEFVKDLEMISNLDISLIKSDDKRNKLRHQKEININLNKEYARYWAQDSSELKIYWDNNSLQFWIEESGLNFKPSERSKGKQWHISFYTKISSKAIQSRTNVILIDEPGLYLHATAQKDVYNRLIDLSKNSQIIYTTHSPYLINRDQLNRVRLILKNYNGSNGTVIENKIHSRADKETLTPILTAIGLALSDGIQNINQVENIVIEGPSDYFYLQGFKTLLKNNSFNLIFGGGSGNMGNVGTILTGWGCKVIYLYDNDQGKADGCKNLEKNWLVSKELIHTIKDGAGSIEDIFSTSDFIKFVLKKKVTIKDLSNSKFIKKTAHDKVLLAKQFNSLCQSNDFKPTKKTMTNIKDLFTKLETAFKR